MTSPQIQIRDPERERQAEIGRGIACAIIDRCTALVDAGRVPQRIVLHPDAAHALGMFFASKGYGGRRLDHVCGIPIGEGSTGGEAVVIITADPADVVAKH